MVTINLHALCKGTLHILIKTRVYMILSRRCKEPMDTAELSSPPSPTHQAIMSMVDNYTHFESTYRNHPEAAVPVLEQVNLLRTALEAFRIAVEAKEDTNPFAEEAAHPDGTETPETIAQDETEPTENVSASPCEEEPHEAPVCKEEAITVVLPVQSEYELELPFIDGALLAVESPEPTPTDERIDPIAQEASLPSIDPIAQESSLPSIGPSGTLGHESNPESTDGPIALSTQEENSAL